jgi:hypothetical protein
MAIFDKFANCQFSSRYPLLAHSGGRLLSDDGPKLCFVHYFTDFLNSATSLRDGEEHFAKKLSRNLPAQLFESWLDTTI